MASRPIVACKANAEADSVRHAVAAPVSEDIHAACPRSSTSASYCMGLQ